MSSQKKGNKQGGNSTNSSTPTKRTLGEHSDSPNSKSANRGNSASINRPSNTPRSTPPNSGSYRGPASQPSPTQPSILNLPQVKRLPATPYHNAMTFVARVLKLEPRRRMFDSRVENHRQKVVFADKYTLLTTFMHSDINEDSSDPKLMEGYTYAITNFRVLKRGELLIHDQTVAEIALNFEIPQMLLDSAEKAYTDPSSIIVDLEDYSESSNSVVSAIVTILTTEEPRQVTSKYSKSTYCRNLSVMATKTAFNVSLWDNAAVYTEVRPGDRVQLNDIKIGRRDDQPNLTVRYSDQIVQHFPIPYHDAQQKSFVICVPHSQVLAGQTIDRNFVDMHILKPSPFFRGSYVTTDRGNTKSLTLEDGSLTTSDGFSEERTIKIIADETGYNKDMKPYKILILDSTIWPLPKVYIPALSEGVHSQHAFKWTVTENVAYLKSFPEHKEVIRELDKLIRQFNDNYMVLQKYISDAARKLEEIWSKANIDFKHVSGSSSCVDGRYDKQLAIALESYIMDGVYKKIFSVVNARCAQSDRILQEKKLHIATISGEKLGLNMQFCCPQDVAVEEISRLSSLRTPIEKLLCMKETLDNISRTVETHLNKSHSFSQKAKTCLASDDLIPLLVMVISQTSPSLHLMAHMYFIENFHWSTSTTDDLSYSLVTFKAATQYILDTDFTELSPKKQDTLNAASDLPTSPPSSEVQSAGAESSASESTRHDRELRRITNLLDMSTLDVTGQIARHPPHSYSRPNTFNYGSRPTPMMGTYKNASKSQQNSGLGEFLSSLKEDGLYSRYGKQT